MSNLEFLVQANYQLKTRLDPKVFLNLQVSKYLFSNPTPTRIAKMKKMIITRLGEDSKQLILS